LNKKIAIIYRNYSTKCDERLISNIKKTCKKDGRKFFLSNNIKLSIKLGLDGVYLPSFYKKLNVSQMNTKNNFLVMGSAHSTGEIKIKEKQGAELIFLSPLFKNKKNKAFLNVIKFNILASKTMKKVIALGGINSKNLNKLKMTNSYGYAGISYFNNTSKIKI